MTKNNKFPEWDAAPGNEMCFCCERSGSKEKMCRWIRNCDPIPGWLAVDSSEVEGVQSYKIFRCPQFLDSPADPGMTRAEYLQSCRSLVINLYRKFREYKHLSYKLMKEKSILNSRLKMQKEECRRLRAKEAEWLIAKVMHAGGEPDDQQQG